MINGWGPYRTSGAYCDQGNLLWSCLLRPGTRGGLGNGREAISPQVLLEPQPDLALLLIYSQFWVVRSY